jgi:hypothetical protein
MDESSFWTHEKAHQPSNSGLARLEHKFTLALCINMLPKDGSCVVAYSIYDKSMTMEKFSLPSASRFFQSCEMNAAQQSRIRNAFETLGVRDWEALRGHWNNLWIGQLNKGPIL